MNAQKCRSCGASILWVEMATTKRRMPVDAAPDRENGNVEVTPKGFANVITDETVLAEARAKGLLHVSHFATCPNAKQHRKGK